MSILYKLASVQNVRSDVPNQELANELSKNNDKEGIKEIVLNLGNKDKKIQSDCIKVLYEIGYINPSLIEDYVDDFIKLLISKNNRLVWGGMYALTTIAERKPKEIFENLESIINTVNKGSVITVDGGIKALSIVASKDETYSKKIFPFLIKHLKECPPKEVAPHSESILLAVDEKNKNDFIEVLEKRKNDLTGSQLTRIKKIYKKLGVV